MKIQKMTHYLKGLRMNKLILLIGCLFAFSSAFCMEEAEKEDRDDTKSEHLFQYEADFGDYTGGKTKVGSVYGQPYGYEYREPELSPIYEKVIQSTVTQVSEHLAMVPGNERDRVTCDLEDEIFRLMREFENSLRITIGTARANMHTLAGDLAYLWGIGILGENDYYYQQSQYVENKDAIECLNGFYVSLYDGVDAGQKIAEAKNSIDDICAGFESLIKNAYFTALLKGDYDGARALMNDYVARNKGRIFDISRTFSIGESEHFKGHKQRNIDEFMANLAKQEYGKDETGKDIVFENSSFKKILESGVVPDNLKVFVHLCNAQDERYIYHNLWLDIKDSEPPFFYDISDDCGQFLSLLMTTSNAAYTLIKDNNELNYREEMLDKLKMDDLCRLAGLSTWGDCMYAGMQEAFVFYQFTKFMQQNLGITNDSGLSAAIDESSTQVTENY